MFKTKKSRRNTIIAIIAIIVCLITFCVAKMIIRKDMSAASGGELLFLFIPLIVYIFIINWKLFKETFFPKDTMFEDYFNEYFTGKDMLETDKSLGAEGIDFISVSNHKQ